MIDDRLAGLREDQRTVAEHGAQEDLQAAVAADIVKCCPDGRLFARRRDPDRRGQPGEAVHDHLRDARRPRGQEHPFGCDFVRGFATTGPDRQAAAGDDGQVERREGLRCGVGDDRVHFGIGDDGGEIFGAEIRRRHHDPSCERHRVRSGRAPPPSGRWWKRAPIGRKGRRGRRRGRCRPPYRRGARFRCRPRIRRSADPAPMSAAAMVRGLACGILV